MVGIVMQGDVMYQFGAIVYISIIMAENRIKDLICL